MIIIDSNIVIALFRGDKEVVRRFEHNFANLAFPAMVVFEIETGLFKSGSGTKRMKTWERIVAQRQVLPVTKEIATIAAMLKANLDQAGTMVSSPDLLIAATAIRHHSPLATRNVREFRRIPGLELEIW